ncbi:hypothetical protein Clacol_002077 [Clathrus columnatus]|uniref:Uncharacterized protein n=1 Tax=Clathrus columnatus TaxID=1419009 RepID=A0AAV5A4A8_9AGAM|nr:hypothetical protein Clacol_002077 [Clathrus columnatus]
MANEHSLTKLVPQQHILVHHHLYHSANLTSLGVGFTILLDTIGTLDLIGLQGLLGIRLYAIYGGNKYILGILLFLYALGVGTSIALVSVKLPTENDVSPLYYRGASINLTQSLAIIIFDTVVFLGTIVKTYGTWKLQREVGSKNRSVTDIILRQELRELHEAQVDKVTLPTLAWSVEGARQGAHYVHETIIAEAAGDLGSYDDEDSPIEDDEFMLVTDHLSTITSRRSDLESGSLSMDDDMPSRSSRSLRRLTHGSFTTRSDDNL